MTSILQITFDTSLAGPFVTYPGNQLDFFFMNLVIHPEKKGETR